MSNVYDFIIGHSHLLLFVFYGIGICFKNKSQPVFFGAMVFALMAGPYEYWSAADTMADGVDLAGIASGLLHGSSFVRSEMILFLSIPFIALQHILSKD